MEEWGREIGREKGNYRGQLVEVEMWEDWNNRVVSKERPEIKKDDGDDEVHEMMFELGGFN